jgi:hypothetical protein
MQLAHGLGHGMARPSRPVRFSAMPALSTWILTRATLPATTYPDFAGAANGRKLTLDATAAASHILSVARAFTAGKQYGMTIDIKAAELWGVKFGFPAAAFGTVREAFFNAATGAVGTRVGAVQVSSVAIGGDWFRVGIYATATANAAAGGCQVWLANANNIAVNGDGVSGTLLANPRFGSR